MPIAAVRWIRDAPTVLANCFREYGDTFTLRFPDGRLRQRAVVVTCDPGTIKEVFTGPSEGLHAGKAAQVLGPLVGQNSLLLLDGQRHLRHRRLMLPPFHGERMKTYVEAMHAETLEEIRALPQAGEVVLHPHLQQTTLRIILRTVFGMQGGREMDSFAEALTQVLEVGSDANLILLNLIPLTFGKKKTFAQLLERADRMLYELIEERRQQADAAEREDVLSMLLAARDEDGQPLTDVELRDELMTLLVAGHETTATSLAWTIRLLLEHPDVLERVLGELDQVVPAGISADDLGNLPILDSVMRESLRIRPVVPMVGRVLQVPMTFRGFRLPAGSAIAPSIWLTHHNPAIYPEPHLFKPERFEGQRINPYQWLPFGGGIRRCLGQAFALVEMKVVMATLLRHLELRTVDNSPVNIMRRSITFAPSDSTRVILRRKPALRAA
jgi:cytochrome P450